MRAGSATLTHLQALVACDTRNPPRAHTLKSPVFDYLRAAFNGFTLREWDHGDGSVTLLARRGTPGTLFNFHLDTVPVADGWSQDPFQLTVDAERATGLGACDIKGALAAMLSACASTAGDVAVLVTADEEAGNSACVRAFLKDGCDFGNVVVAEPTGCRAVSSHRGIISGSVRFRGITGHASNPEALHGSAIHRAMRWGNACLAAVAGDPPYADTPLRDVRINIGQIDGGVKPNMIASTANLTFNLRTRPVQDQQQVLKFLQALAGDGHTENWQTRFLAPPLPDAQHGDAAIEAGIAFATRNGLEPAEAVDFWTEAALFSAAGLTTIVLGSGDIAQAHTANEWVALSELERMQAIYCRLIADGIE